MITAEYTQELIEELYEVKDKVSKNKDKASKKHAESVQIVIDMLDDLQMSGSLYLDEE